MKTTFFFILLALAFASNTFGQVLLEERIECKLQNPWAVLPADAVENQNQFAVTPLASASENPDPTPLLIKGGQKPGAHTAVSFELNLATDTSIRFNSYDGGVIEGTIKNLTHEMLKVVYHRWQYLPDTNWSSTICLDQCYSSIVDSLPWGATEYSPLPPDGTIPFILHFYPSANSSDSGTVYVRLAIIGSTEDDTVGMWYKGVSFPASAVRKSTTSSGGYKISSVYPSPLVSGSSIKVKVYSPQSTTYSYSIFDAVGREVAYGSTRHRLLIGDNTIEIASLEGLTPGNYILRFNFQGGGSDAYPFQVIR